MKAIKRLYPVILALVLCAAAVIPVGDVSRALAQNGSDWRCVVVNGQMGLNVRRAPGTDDPVVSTLAAGDQLEADYSHLESIDGYNWVPVRFAAGSGWAITARLSPCESAYDDPEHEVVLDHVNDDGLLDRDEIAAIARSVVLVASVQGDVIVATGTGTITTTDGLIVTNAHVVEDSDVIAIAMLDDINDPPEYRYVGEVINLDSDIDVALVAIRYDLDGNPVQAVDLDLPYIPATKHADEVFRGDPVYIFGYPGIGDDYLVVTSGSIVSVENGDLDGQRLPMWYRTDAEIAPGSSGGLVVNGNGEFVGIPTFVRSEDETGGRLGGIRPAQVALLAVLDEDQALVANPAETPVKPSTEPPVDLTLESLTVDHGALVDGQAGLQIHLWFGVDGWMEQNATVYARFYYDDVTTTPLVNLNAPSAYRDATNGVITSALITPCCEETVYEDLAMFIPYAAFGLVEPGVYALKYRLEVVSEDLSWRHTLSWEYFSYRR